MRERGYSVTSPLSVVWFTTTPTPRWPYADVNEISLSVKPLEKPTQIISISVRRTYYLVGVRVHNWVFLTFVYRCAFFSEHLRTFIVGIRIIIRV